MPSEKKATPWKGATNAEDGDGYDAEHYHLHVRLPDLLDGHTKPTNCGYDDENRSFADEEIL